MSTDRFKLPATFDAWTWHQPGEPEGLTRATLTLEPPGSSEVVVATRTIGLNPVDWKFIAMDSALWKPGQIPGVDAAGEVLACGDGVTHLSPGDRVAVHTTLAGPGTFATHLRLPARAVMPLPEGIDWASAAAFPCPGLTAWQAIGKLPTKPAARLLITGASGNVGRWLVQLAARRGFHVIAMASARRHDILRELGADETLETPESLTAPVFAVIDTVSSEHARRMTDAISANGHVVCIQGRLDETVVPPFNRARSQHEVALGALHQTGSNTDWAELRQAGGEILEDVAARNLTLPAPEVDSFAALPRRLAELKGRGPRPLKTVITP